MMKAITTSIHDGFLRRGLGAILALAILATLGSICPGSATAQSDWEQLPDMPIGKWEAGTVILDDKLYFFGGYTQGVRSSKTCHIYDPKDGSWTPFQDLPSAITHMNMVLGRSWIRVHLLSFGSKSVMMLMTSLALKRSWARKFI